MIFETIVDTIGNTPLVRLHHVTGGSKADLVVKCEFLNPGGSVKDRIGLTMIEAAEKEGKLKPGGTIIECTSGNTGLGLALVSILRGYRTICTMPDKMSQEKINLLKAYGAEVVVCPTAVEPEDPRSYYSVAKRLSEEIPNSFYPNQYQNPNNPRAHYESTGPEIWRDTEGRITHFVCGMGTGGTISGAGRYLKEKNPAIRVIGADTIGSLYLEYFKTGKLGHAHTYLIEGIGEDFIPGTIDFQYIDDVIQISDKDAYNTARRLARREAIFTGSSGGAAIAAGLQVARDLGEGDLVVVLLPDTGQRYLSKVYNDEWMRENQLLEAKIHISASEVLSAKRGSMRELLSVGPGMKCSEALELMKSRDVSQIPVLEDGRPVGRVHEDDMIDLMIRGRALSEIPVREVMGEPLPVVTGEGDLNQISTHLHAGAPAILVDQGNGAWGIITRYDLLNVLRQS